jgi:hypothetical protein
MERTSKTIPRLDILNHKAGQRKIDALSILLYKTANIKKCIETASPLTLLKSHAISNSITHREH